MTEARKLVRLPTDLAVWVAARAAGNDRSANKEIVNILKAAMAEDQQPKQETNQ